MALYLVEDTFDLGVTSIENLFIDEFLPFADATCIKVYLTAMRLLSQKKGELTIHDLSRRLSISESDIKEAFIYWKNQGLVDIQGDDVSFKTLRNIYLEENYDRKQHSTTLTYADHYQGIFKAINSVLHVPLIETEREHFVQFYHGKEIDEEIILLAFEESKTRKYRVKHAIDLLRHWLENDLKTLDDVLLFKERFNKRQKQYKDILHALGRGYEGPTIADKESIDLWIDELGFSMPEILSKIKEITMNKSKPTMSYLNKVFENTKTEQQDSTNKNEDKSTFDDFFRRRL